MREHHPQVLRAREFLANCRRVAWPDGTTTQVLATEATRYWQIFHQIKYQSAHVSPRAIEEAARQFDLTVHHNGDVTFLNCVYLPWSQFEFDGVYDEALP
ncbi:MAG TPA: hypothetical protein VK196_22605 [Magnetospirillum sp.]|nr:hypothetical protein [Magnetospirillum sp.]